MTSIEERLRDALMYMYPKATGYDQDDEFDLQRELAARGLIVVERDAGIRAYAVGLKTGSDPACQMPTDNEGRADGSHQIIRALLHLLDTSNGYWVTDRPCFVSRGREAVHTTSKPHDGYRLEACFGTYHRQDFSNTDEVKMAREALGETISSCALPSLPPSS